MRKFALILACCGAFYVLLFIGFRFLTDVGALEKSYPHVIYNKKAKTARVEIRPKPPAGWVNLGSVSSLAVAAIVLSEDWAFYEHNGFDWEQIRDSMEKNLKEGRYARGGSTITQQVVKNVFLNGDKTLSRKVKEAILAMRLERQLTKKRILELYLNVVEFGEGLYGIGPAAHYYFHKPASQLNAKEGAFLAMLLPSPKKYSVSHRQRGLTRYAYSTVKSILGKLLATQRLTEDAYHAALNTPLSFEDHPVVVSAGSEPEDEDVEDSVSRSAPTEGIESNGTEEEDTSTLPEEEVIEEPLTQDEPTEPAPSPGQ